MCRFWLLVFAAGAALPLSVSAIQGRVLFLPSVTDPAITQFNNSHYAVVDPANTNQGRLVLFLPGTGATPALYRAFPTNAASLGFHALGLMYPNGDVINSLCAQFAPPAALFNRRLHGVSFDSTRALEGSSQLRPGEIFVATRATPFPSPVGAAWPLQAATMSLLTKLETLFHFGCYDYAAPDGAPVCESPQDSILQPKVGGPSRMGEE